MPPDKESISLLYFHPADSLELAAGFIYLRLDAYLRFVFTAEP